MENTLKGIDPNNMGYMQQFNDTVKESAKKIQDRNEKEQEKVYVTSMETVNVGK